MLIPHPWPPALPLIPGLVFARSTYHSRQVKPVTDETLIFPSWAHFPLSALAIEDPTCRLDATFSSWAIFPLSALVIEDPTGVHGSGTSKSRIELRGKALPTCVRGLKMWTFPSWTGGYCSDDDLVFEDLGGPNNCDMLWLHFGPSERNTSYQEYITLDRQVM
jgi:hypothetical protein